VLRQRSLDIVQDPALLGEPLLQPLSMKLQVPVHGLRIGGIDDCTDLRWRHLLRP
jgi:hypothetical protein